jgi:hypothetical protein
MSFSGRNDSGSLYFDIIVLNASKCCFIMQKLNEMIKVRCLEPETNEFIAVEQIYFMKTCNWCF